MTGAVPTDALAEVWNREVAAAESALDAEDELLARAAAGGSFWGEGKVNPKVEIVGPASFVPGGKEPRKPWHRFCGAWLIIGGLQAIERRLEERLWSKP